MNAFPSDTGKGYLTVRVSTARGAIPLENAEVTFRSSDKNDSGVLYRTRTDINGMTPMIPLSAPPKTSSEAPGAARPYGLYNVEVYAEGYYKQFYENVPVFDGVSAIQTAELIPLEKNGFEGNVTYDPIRFFENDGSNYNLL